MRFFNVDILRIFHSRDRQLPQDMHAKCISRIFGEPQIFLAINRPFAKKMYKQKRNLELERPNLFRKLLERAKKKKESVITF